MADDRLSLTDADLFRIVRDIFVDELSRSRRDAFEKPDARDWSMETSIRAAGLHLDSLERFTLAGRLNETFSLYRSGIEDNLLRAATLGDTVAVIAAGLSHYAEEMHFYSGGTLGSPAIVSHAASDLLDEITELVTIFRDRRRVVVTVPVHHIYGFLFGVLLPHALQVPVIDAQYALLSGEARPRDGDLVVSIPFLWEQYLPRVSLWGAGVVGSSSTAPLAPELGEALCRAGLTRVVEIYGSSETAGVGWRDHCPADPAGEANRPFSLFTRWTRENEETLRVGDRSIMLPDRIEWRDERRFLPRGRRDAVVQVGGVNVDLEALRRTILELIPEADDCALRLSGERLRLFVATGTAAPAITAAEIAGRLRAALPDHAVPPAVTLGSTLPRTPTGKPADW